MTPKKFGDCTNDRGDIVFQRWLARASRRCVPSGAVGEFLRRAARNFSRRSSAPRDIRDARERATSTRRAASEALRHQHRFGGRRRAVVHRSVGDFLAGQLAHQRLKFEDGLQRALRDFRLIRRVGSKKFAALDNCVGDDRAQVVVDARAQKTGVAERIFRRALLEILNDFRFGKRPGQIQRPASADTFRECSQKDRRSISRRWQPAFPARSAGLLGR